MKTETPRTEDKILVGTNTLNQGEYVEAEFARELERELRQECNLRSGCIAKDALSYVEGIKVPSGHQNAPTVPN